LNLLVFSPRDLQPFQGLEHGRARTAERLAHLLQVGVGVLAHVRSQLFGVELLEGVAPGPVLQAPRPLEQPRPFVDGEPADAERFFRLAHAAPLPQELHHFLS
jgi:hypothetical protein